MEKPTVCIQTAQQLLLRHFNVSTEKIIQLPGYDDLNYKITSTTKECFLLKFGASSYTEDPDRLKRQHLILKTLQDDGTIVSQRVLPNLNGELFCFVLDDNGRKHVMRLLHFIPGKVFMSLAPYEVLASECMGRFLAKLHMSLRGVQDASVHFAQQPMWSMENIPKFLSYGDCLDGDRRILIANTIESFREMLDRMSSSDFPKQLIHGDPNEMNILVREDLPSIQDTEDIAIIDWEDSSYTYRIFDLAIFAMSLAVCLEFANFESAFLLHCEACLRGYHSVSELTKQEIEKFPKFVAARLAQSLVMGHFTYAKTGNEYVLQTAKNDGWKKLEWMSRDEFSNLVIHI